MDLNIKMAINRGWILVIKLIFKIGRNLKINSMEQARDGASLIMEVIAMEERAVMVAIVTEEVILTEVIATEVTVMDQIVMEQMVMEEQITMEAPTMEVLTMEDMETPITGKTIKIIMVVVQIVLKVVVGRKVQVHMQIDIKHIKPTTTH